MNTLIAYKGSIINLFKPLKPTNLIVINCSDNYINNNFIKPNYKNIQNIMYYDDTHYNQDFINKYKNSQWIVHNSHCHYFGNYAGYKFNPNVKKIVLSHNLYTDVLDYFGLVPYYSLKYCK